MTTEIAVLNRLGIALATDSAVTIAGGSSDKIFDSADKLFELSPIFPVALMINGNMDCLGVPWEIIAKDFRESQGFKQRDHIKGWMNDFLAFVTEYDALSSSKAEEIIKERVDTICDYIKSEVTKGFYDRFRARGSKSAQAFAEFRKAVRAAIVEIANETQETYNELGVADSLHNIDREAICAGYGALANEAIKKQFIPHPVEEPEIEAVKSLCISVLIAQRPRNTLLEL